MGMEFLKWGWSNARGTLSTSIGRISFSGTDHRHRLFRHLSRSFGSFNDAGNQFLVSQAQAELQHPLSHVIDPEAAEAAEAAAEATDRAVSNSSGGGGGDVRRPELVPVAEAEGGFVGSVKAKLIPNHMAREFWKRAGRKIRGAALSTSIGSISFSGTDHRLFRRLNWNFGSFNDVENQFSVNQTQIQRRHALEHDLEAAAAVTAEVAVEHAPTTDLDAPAPAEGDRAVSNSSGEDGEGRAGRGSGPTAAAEEARVSNTSNSKTIGELAVPMLACMGIYSTIHKDEQLQHLHPSLYFSLLTLLASGAYASLYSVFYDLAKPTAGEGRGGGGGEEEERELVKRKWLKVALTCTGLALSLRVALGLIS